MYELIQHLSIQNDASIFSIVTGIFTISNENSEEMFNYHILTRNSFTLTSKNAKTKTNLDKNPHRKGPKQLVKPL